MNIKKQKKFILTLLYDVIRRRKKLDPKEKEYSYTVKLFSLGKNYICKKVQEEAKEVVDSALKESPKRTIQESADLLYHLLVVLEVADVKFEDVLNELKKRKSQSGLEEKKNRS